MTFGGLSDPFYDASEDAFYSSFGWDAIPTIEDVTDFYYMYMMQTI